MLAGVGVLITSLSMPAAAETPAATASLHSFEETVDREFAALEQAQAALLASQQRAAETLSEWEPAELPEPFRTAFLAAIDNLDARAAAVQALLDDKGRLPAMQSLIGFAADRATAVREAPILEEDRAALLRVWNEILTDARNNAAAVQAQAAGVRAYRQHLASHRITIGEYLIVGDWGAVSRLVDAIVSPDGISQTVHR